MAGSWSVITEEPQRITGEALETASAIFKYETKENLQIREW